MQSIQLIAKNIFLQTGPFRVSWTKHSYRVTIETGANADARRSWAHIGYKRRPATMWSPARPTKARHAGKVLSFSRLHFHTYRCTRKTISCEIPWEKLLAKIRYLFKVRFERICFFSASAEIYDGERTDVGEYITHAWVHRRNYKGYRAQIFQVSAFQTVSREKLLLKLIREKVLDAFPAGTARDSCQTTWITAR